MVILTICTIGAIIHFMQILFIPLIIATLFALLLTPLVNLMEKIKIPRLIGIALVLGAFFVLLYTVGRVFYSSLHTFTQVFGEYQKRFIAIINVLWLRFNVPHEYFPQFGWTRNLINRIMQISGSFVNFGTHLGLVLFLLIFMLVETPRTWRKLHRAFPKHFNNKFGNALADITQQVAHYLRVKTIISAVTGTLVWLSLRIIGQDMAALWGLMAFLLNFIPNLGSTFIMAATMLLGLAQFYPEWNKIIAVWIVMPTIQILMGNILDPLIQGDQLDLSPLVIIVSLVLWGWILGITGMFLAVPLTVALKIILDHIKSLQPLSIMMGSGKMSRSYRRHWIKTQRSLKKSQ